MSIPRYGEQNKENWQIYQNETSKIKDIPIIEVAGNHDMFGIKSLFSPENYFLDSSHSFTRNNTKKEDDFLIQSFVVGKSKTNVIAINPFDFPTSHPPLLLYKKFDKHLLSLIDKHVSKSSSKSIVVCHYPIGSIHSQKTRTDLDFSDLISTKNKVNIFLSGHSHPNDPAIFHHQNSGFEIIGTSSYQQSQIGLVSIDNGGISWTAVNFSKPQKGIITYPIPMKQLSQNFQ